MPGLIHYKEYFICSENALNTDFCKYWSNFKLFALHGMHALENLQLNNQKKISPHLKRVATLPCEM